ncbi:hypothetical protein I4U23_021221 [Adineta vaga]|nr:hypothetical protein I4U23_021221 [Adineta vaga]
MELPREYINPKYFADFQRRYRKDIQKHGTRKKKSNLVKNKTDNGYNAFNLTKQMDVKIENDDIIEISSKKAVKTTSSSSPIILSNSTSSESKSPPEFIVVDTDDEDNDDHLNTNENSSYFIDRSSTSFTAVSQPIVQTSTDDYHKEDSKYAQLPSRSTSSSTIIRPIISKHQRRKQSQIKDSSKPLVSAIDRIIDQMDQSNTLNDSNTMEEQNLLIKQIKKRKKKKKKSVTTN